MRGDKLRYADTAALGVVVFLLFGRAGCASVHDHVGIATEFPLAVDFLAENPAGVIGPHHDLGLCDVALFGVLVAVSAWLLRVPRRPGWCVGIVAISDGLPRFWLDMLRRESVDPRYAMPPRCREPTPWRVHLREQLGLRRPAA
ncbi:MAG: prolipoprotein diacylglyceryl transferase family protein [Kofleriaceae bacterium]